MMNTNKVVFVVLAFSLLFSGSSLETQDINEKLLPCCEICARRCTTSGGQIDETCYHLCAQHNCSGYCGTHTYILKLILIYVFLYIHLHCCS